MLALDLFFIIVVKYCTCVLRMLIERRILDGLARDDEKAPPKADRDDIRLPAIWLKVAASWRYFILDLATVTRVFA